MAGRHFINTYTNELNSVWKSSRHWKLPVRKLKLHISGVVLAHREFAWRRAVLEE